MIDRRGFSFIAILATVGLFPLIIRSGLAASPPDGFAMHDEPIELPPISFQSGRGEAKTLSSFAGKVVLLNLWATWCGPCRAEMPMLDNLQATLGGSDFEVLPLSIDRGGADKVRDFYRELGLEDLMIYIDPTATAQRRLRVVGIPTTLLVDRNGRELGRLAGPAEWDSTAMITFFKSVIEGSSGRQDLEIKETQEKRSVEDQDRPG